MCKVQNLYLRSFLSFFLLKIEVVIVIRVVKSIWSTLFRFKIQQRPIIFHFFRYFFASKIHHGNPKRKIISKHFQLFTERVITYSNYHSRSVPLGFWHFQWLYGCWIPKTKKHGIWTLYSLVYTGAVKIHTPPQALGLLRGEVMQEWVDVTW